jgi:hypothetical protein
VDAKELSAVEAALLKKPDWDSCWGANYDWRTYVPQPLREGWATLSADAKRAAYLVAEAAAARDEFDSHLE